MSVTSTSAITRLSLNTWQSREVHISDDATAGGTVVIDYKDSAGALAGTVTVRVRSGDADKVVYNSKGEITVTPLGVTSSGIGAALLTALSSGTLAQRFQAVDTLLQTRTVIPA